MASTGVGEEAGRSGRARVSARHGRGDVGGRTTELLPGLPGHELTGAEGAPVIAVLGGISASRHVASADAEGRSGWWDTLVGPGRAIDLGRYRVLGVDWLDGGRDAHGLPARVVTTRDQADALAARLDRLGIPQLHAIVGASYGGMVALAFAAAHRGRVRRLVVISAAHESAPMSTALRALQRQVVELGLATGRGQEALRIARGIAMTTYRTAAEFADRFPPDGREGREGFAVERYLAHAGRKFAAAFTPERFLALSLSADLHRVEPEEVHAPATIVAADGDALVPRSQLVTLARELGAPARLVRLATRHGHDAFLTDPDRIGPILSTALSNRIFR